jgi:hypothetical protein
MGYLKLRYIILLALALRVAFPVLILGSSQDINVFYDNDTIEYIEPARTYNIRAFAMKVCLKSAHPRLSYYSCGIMAIWVVTIVLQIVLSCFGVFIIYKTDSFISFCTK